MTRTNTQSPRADATTDSPSRDEVLKRMLKMKPKPHKGAGTLMPSKRVKAKSARKVHRSKD